MNKRKNKKLRVSKRLVWLKHFLNESNPVTFLNKTASAKASKYKGRTEASFGQIGYENYRKHEATILKWLEDNKFSLSALRQKHSELLECNKTMFHKVKGTVDPNDLDDGVRIVAQSSKMAVSGRGEDAEVYDDGETLLAINVGDPEIQRKALDMAYKLKGEYAPEKREIGGIGGGAIPLTAFPPEPKTIEEWEKNRKIAEQKRLDATTQSQ
jgi:hypothetical protein